MGIFEKIVPEPLTSTNQSRTSLRHSVYQRWIEAIFKEWVGQLGIIKPPACWGFRRLLDRFTPFHPERRNAILTYSFGARANRGFLYRSYRESERTGRPLSRYPRKRNATKESHRTMLQGEYCEAAYHTRAISGESAACAFRFQDQLDGISPRYI